jgi:hypothetical protein
LAPVGQVGEQLRRLHRRGRARSVGGDAGVHRRRLLAQLRLQLVERVQFALGVEQVDPGDGGGDAHAAGVDGELGFAFPDAGLGARGTGVALGPVGDVLGEADPHHAEVVPVRPARQGAGDREVGHPDRGLGVGQLARGADLVLGGLDAQGAGLHHGGAGDGARQGVGEGHGFGAGGADPDERRDRGGEGRARRQSR